MPYLPLGEGLETFSHQLELLIRLSPRPEHPKSPKPGGNDLAARYSWGEQNSTAGSAGVQWQRKKVNSGAELM